MQNQSVNIVTQAISYIEDNLDDKLELEKKLLRCIIPNFICTVSLLKLLD